MQISFEKRAGNPSFAGGPWRVTRLLSLHSLSAAAASWSHFPAGPTQRERPRSIRRICPPRRLRPPPAPRILQPGPPRHPQPPVFCAGPRHRGGKELGRPGGEEGRGGGGDAAAGTDPEGRMRRGLQPSAPAAAPPPAPSTDSRAAPAGFPARFAAGTFIQIRSTGAVAGAPCVVSSSSAAASQAPGAFAPAADGGQPAGSSLYCTPHGPAGRTALLQPALGGGGGRPPVILCFPPVPAGRVKGTGGDPAAGRTRGAGGVRGGGQERRRQRFVAINFPACFPTPAAGSY